MILIDFMHLIVNPIINPHVMKSNANKPFFQIRLKGSFKFSDFMSSKEHDASVEI